jgi:putative hydrolase of the HAD superfamily
MAERLIDNVKCVIFDLDDTLYPEIEYCKSGFRAVAADISSRYSLQAETVYGHLWRFFSSGDRKKVFNNILDEFSIKYAPDEISRLVNHYRNHLPQIKLDPQFKTVYESLRKRVRLGLLTDGYMPAQELKVKSLGIEEYFDIIIYTELLGRENWKPSSAGFELIMGRDNFAPAQYVYVADNPAKDFIAPNRLGWRSVWLNKKDKVHRNSPVNDLQKGEFEISELIELQDIITNGN